MAYTVKSGDTIYDAAFNIAGSLAGVDQLLEINTSEQYPPIWLDQLQTGVNIENGGYSAVFKELTVGDNKTIEIYFRTPAYPNAHDNIIFSESTTSQDGMCLIINMSFLIIKMNGEEIWKHRVTLNEDYHIIIARGDRPSRGHVWLNGIYYDSVVLPASPDVPNLGFLLGGFPTNVPAFDCDVHFARMWNIKLDADRVRELWNNGYLISTHIEGDWNLALEYLPENVSTYSWISTGIANTSEYSLRPTGSPEIIMDFFDVPVTNQMETYTPTLIDGQILDTAAIPIYNIQAVEKQLFNSTYNNKDAVKDELKQLGYILDTNNYPYKAYIEFIISGDSTTPFMIPFCAYPANNEKYAFDICVNGEYLDTARGTANYLEGTGYEIPLNKEQVTIRLTYADDPYNPPIGWGRAIGYCWTQWSDGVPPKGAALNIYRDRIRHINNANDYAFLKSETDSDFGFKCFTWAYCSNLDNTDGEDLPDTITSLGTFFRSGTYQSCVFIKEANREYLPNGITYINHNFREREYSNCRSMSIIYDEHIPHAVTAIGNNFRYENYTSCVLLLKPTAEIVPPLVRTIGRNFRSNQYMGCNRLLEAAVEVLPEGITNINVNYRSNMYNGCRNLSAAAVEVLPKSVKNIDSGYRTSTYANSGIIQAAREAFNPGCTIGDRYRVNQYLNCSNLSIGSYIHAPVFATEIMEVESYNSIFGSTDVAITKADTMPSYYLDDTETTTAIVTTLTPTNPKGYVTNRTGIEGYNELNTNWK